MNGNDSRDAGTGRGNRAGEMETPVAARDTLGMRQPSSKRPPDSARCAGCGSDGLSSIRYFSAGSGVATHPFIEDVICHGCGHTGPPALVLE
jgi:hypothetical protein